MKNPKLEARLLAMLPPGTDIQDASLGFKNWGQFVAAVHVVEQPGHSVRRSEGENDRHPDRLDRADHDPDVARPGDSVLQGEAAAAADDGSAATPPPPTGTAAATWTPTKIRSEVKKAEDAANTDLRRSRESS